MRDSVRFAALAFISISAFGAASGALAQGAPDPSTFTDTQREGLRLFSQSCGVCHTPVQQRTRQYGPVLSRDTLGGDEELMREFIGLGTDRMPGFRFYFEPVQIADIVQFIKTLPPQPAPAAAK
jgi:mono/diheme cytochrome c family protein